MDKTDENLAIDGLPMSIAWHPNGKLIAFGSSNGNVYLLGAETGEVRVLLTGAHTDQVRTVSFNHDASLLASGSYDNTAAIWKLD
ncbi:hypothetical protein MNBD_ALPHA06-1453 [hydrothermal vent metagenome]|uniref:Anaphase-promoting complex subunit 4-like WD40 domain-containing protein n=1 Tax=hydrothermal vent metagenome TaxID=652676 RepID=A0A3B0RQ41_9ZZZZ